MLHDEIQVALRELNQALYNHEEWCSEIYATLICRLVPDERDIDQDAHHKCRFGQWLYGSGAIKLNRHPCFSELEREHESLHRSAARMLLADRRQVPISVADFERFITAMKRTRLEVLTLKQEFETALYNMDPLTNTASRTGMLTKLREQQELVKRQVHDCCIAMMDLDHFKVVNDTHGHIVGDKVLAAVAHYTSSHLRPYDIIFRYGGEEFLICMPDADLNIAQGIIERIRVELASIFYEGDGQSRFHVTVSFGIALLDPDDPVEKSIDRADKALYAAKTSGRNCAIIWSSSMASAISKAGS